jgi:RimJ/RimL family protein N-acetyltransferase
MSERFTSTDQPLHALAVPSGDPSGKEWLREGPTLRTERLRLRRWTDEDRDVFAQISADPEVMRYRLAPLSRHESDALIDETEASFDRNGFGLWAVERIEDGRLLGFTGFGTSTFDAAFCPAVDIGWTLARDMWGHGYATEGAVAALDFAFDHLQLDEVVAHTTQLNERSRAVMGRLGMTHDPADDFDAPWYQPENPRRRFVLYRLKVTDWRGHGPGYGQ